MDTIPLKEALKIAREGVRFSIAYVAADKTTKRGGRWIEIADARLKNEPPVNGTRANNFQPATNTTKCPNHDKHSTILLHLPNGQIRKAHIRLIRRFNNKTII